MCEELRLERYDNSPWGFRLTGGLDFGTPLSIIKVTGGSIAELNSIKTGDLVIEINGQPTNHFTHTDAQNCIASSGNYLTLQVMRGSLVTPPVSPIRGMSPAPDTTDEQNHTFSAQNLSQCLEKVNDDRRNVRRVISRQLHDSSDGYRSPPRVHQKLGESATLTKPKYTVNDEGQLLLGDRALSDLEIAELMTGNEEVLDEGVLGINFNKFLPRVDFIRKSEVFKLLQKESITKDISEQAQLKKEPSKRFSTFLVKPKGPHEGEKGPTFVKFKPPRYLPKPPEHKWELPRLKPWERPKKEPPTHSVLWLFLEEKGEDVIDERWGTIEEERENMSRNSCIEFDLSSLSSGQQNQENDLCSVTSTDQDGRESQMSKVSESGKEQICKSKMLSGSAMSTSEVCKESGNENKTLKPKALVWLEEIEPEPEPVDSSFVVRSGSGMHGRISSMSKEESKNTEDMTLHDQLVITEDSLTSKKTVSSKLVSQLTDIQGQIEALENEAPSDLQSQLLAVKEQLAKIVQIKTKVEKNSQAEQFEEKFTKQSRQIEQIIDSENISTGGTVNRELKESKGLLLAEDHSLNRESQCSLNETFSQETLRSEHTSKQSKHEQIDERTEHFEETEEHIEVLTTQVEHEFEYEMCEAPQRSEHKYYEAPQTKKSPAHPITPQLRPIVLPGGRMWRQPKDAEHEEFYQGILVAQAEVLVGSTIGVNFTKYVPPKVDMTNSEVYRYIHETEDLPTRGPGEKEMAHAEKDYYQPISKRHFYAATLREPSPLGVVELNDMI